MVEKCLIIYQLKTVDYDVLRNVVKLLNKKSKIVMLEIKNLKKTFDGGTEALRGVNLKSK